jgi:secreted PhoX family phosphatase
VFVSLSRRTLLRGAAAGGAFAALRALGLREALAQTSAGKYGSLVTDPAGILDLPAGFSYRVLSKLNQTMTDNLPTPARPDGMGAFAGSDGTTLLVRNHEMTASTTNGGVRLPAQYRYDPGNGAHVRGGTTTLVVGADGRLLGSYATLGGTLRNCAGGTTPWGTWITCEETVDTPQTDARLTKRHGYCFEVRASARGPVTPVPLKPLGRFRHEAVAVDPIGGTGRIYLTEDESDGCFYRFKPTTWGKPAAGGTLAAMRLLAFPNGVNTRTGLPLGRRFEIEWVRISNVDPASGQTPVRHQARALGAATLSRTEGIVWHPRDQAFYISATDGGRAGCGQLFKFTPHPTERWRGTFELFLEASGPDSGSRPDEWEWPDNLAVSPWGDLFVCQDQYTDGREYISIVGSDGTVSRFARNALNNSEFAGACFRPGGRTLFVNIHGDNSTPGMTLAITGRW